jgi:hypothetical protein
MPASGKVPVSRYAVVSINWKVTSNATVPVTVSSASGEFHAGSAGGPLLESARKTIKSTISNGDTASLAERLYVPAHVVFKAHRMGHTSVVYVRSFSDGGVSAKGSHALNIRGAAGADFSIQNLSLIFDDESKQRHTTVGEEIHALATVNFSGSGLLQAVWEVAEPLPGGSDNMGFRSLVLVHRRLVAGDRLILTSPELPTVRAGLHKVRLRITNPAMSEEIPELQYSVKMPPEN